MKNDNREMTTEDGWVYFGKSTTQVYDPITKEWTKVLKTEEEEEAELKEMKENHLLEKQRDKEILALLEKYCPNMDKYLTIKVHIEKEGGFENIYIHSKRYWDKIATDLKRPNPKRMTWWMKIKKYIKKKK